MSEYKHKTYEQLSGMHIVDLKQEKEKVLNAIDEKRKERDSIIGQILFYQETLKDWST